MAGDPERAPAEELTSAGSSPRRGTPQAIAPWVRTVARWLDEAIPIPFTKFRVGLDGILGLLFPGAGDAVTAVGAASLLIAALKQGVPSVILVRMVLNIGIDALVGCLPFVGDAFDFVFKANSRNLALMEQYAGHPERRPTTKDYLIVGVGIALIVLSVVLPALVVATLLGGISGVVSR